MARITWNRTQPQLNFSAREVAELTGAHYNTVLKAIHLGELKAVKIGGALRVPLSALKEMGLDVPDTIPAASAKEAR